MDQVRNILRIVWQQRFWVLSVLGVIVAAICWKMGASAIDTQTAANKQAITTQFTDMEAIQRKQYMGNDAVNAEEFQQTSLIRDKVVELWEKMYASQREKVLKWPAALGEEFLDYVEKKRFRDPITDPDMLQIYREYAKERFPELVEIVDAQKMAEGALTGGAFGGGGEGRMPMGRDGGYGGEMMDPNNPLAQEKYLVRWFDQAALRQQLDFASMPTSLKVWVTQEDLWVYETLLNAIAEVNEERGATRPDNTAIADIMALEVGRAAAMQFKQPGVIMLPVAPMGGEAGMEAGRGGEGMGAPGMDGRGEFGADGAAADPDAGLLAFRYIGDDGQPIADDATAVDAAAQFRRLPVRMLLKIEQTAVPNLLAACANATLPVEVKRVRINSDKSESGATMGAAMTGGGGDGGRGGYGGRGGEFGGGGGYGGRGGEFGGGRDGGGAAMMTSPDAIERKELATVEIHGIVYIYNPPDATTLTVPGGPPESVAAAETGGELAVQ
jgi:hypothetical protein